MSSRRVARDEDPVWSLVDVLTLLSPFLFVFVLIAFSSSPLTISPSESEGERGLILPDRGGLQDDTLLRWLFTMR